MAHRRRVTHATRGVGYLVLTALAFIAPAQAGKCSLRMLPPLEVTMRGLRPLVHAQLNGHDTLFIADSGAFFSTVTATAARQFQLKLERDTDVPIVTLGGMQHAQVARAGAFTLLGKTLADIEFLVVDTSFDNDAVGLLGQNVFLNFDVEYDLANGVIRLLHPQDCKDAPLAYWAAPENKPFSTIEIEFATRQAPHTKAVAYLNGTKIRVAFDTGSPVSYLSLSAAKRAGVTPSSEGVAPGRMLGNRKTWIKTFASFKIGDEEIQNAALRFGEGEFSSQDMLIGADFFLSHRIYVATSQRKLYFTYNGGPVFNLETARSAATQAAAGPGAVAPGPETAAKELPAAQEPDARLDSPTDAPGYARRAAASVARHDYAAAIADLTRACELAPGESEYFYERGMAQWNNRQADLALGDFDQAIKLKPANAEALVARAMLRARRPETRAAGISDLEAADDAAPKEADVHLQMAALYEYLGQPAAALLQYSKWIDSHPRDYLQMPQALNGRCWLRALEGQGLDQALSDCNAALRARPDTAAFLDSRGLVYLRQGNYDKAIADYDAALKQRPKVAWSLYGRGLARIRKGKTAEGQADLAQATALQPKIAEVAAHYGLNP